MTAQTADKTAVTRQRAAEVAMYWRRFAREEAQRAAADGDLSGLEKLFLERVFRWVAETGEPLDLSVKMVAEWMGCPERGCRRMLRRLVRRNYIDVTPPPALPAAKPVVGAEA